MVDENGENSPSFFARLYSESAFRYKSVCVVFYIPCGIPTWYTETVHSISNPGRTEVYVLDSRVSSHQLHPEDGDSQSLKWNIFTPWHGHLPKKIVLMLLNYSSAMYSCQTDLWKLNEHFCLVGLYGPHFGSC